MSGSEIVNDDAAAVGTGDGVGRKPSPILKVAIVLLVAMGGLAAVFAANVRTASDEAQPGTGMPAAAGEYRFEVGEPGPGDEALPIHLPSTVGGTFDLADRRGQTVLLYFQEGIMCQPCWDQLIEIERRWKHFEALGIDSIVSITTDPLDALKQKVADEDLATPILSDHDPMFEPDRSVQEAYRTNRYGMMGRMHSGHTFIVVNEDGEIEWRADYGGAPDYTMYLPVKNLVADMEVGLKR